MEYNFLAINLIFFLGQYMQLEMRKEIFCNFT